MSKITKEKFLETLKDPEQVKDKQAIINMIDQPSCKILDISFQEVAPGDFRFIISISAV